jgi:HD superfamily phosphohydrolase YqeK
MTKKSILDELLNDEDTTFKPNEEEDTVLSPLLDQINLITNQHIRMFVRSVLLQAKTFWKIPSSFSGKHHPVDEHTAGGNVLHTRRVINVAKVLAESYSLNQEERDLIYAACLLHDVTKGVSADYDPMHPYTVGIFVRKCQENDKKYGSELSSSTLFLDQETVESILRLIRCHLGPWSPVPETYPTTYLDMIVHISDNIASKLHTIAEDKTQEDI